MNVFADSPASQNMLINICRSAKPRVNSLPDRNYSRSVVDELKSFSGNNCQSTLNKEGSETTINCNQVTIKVNPSDSRQSIDQLVTQTASGTTISGECITLVKGKKEAIDCDRVIITGLEEPETQTLNFHFLDSNLTNKHTICEFFNDW